MFINFNKLVGNLLILDMRFWKETYKEKTVIFRLRVSWPACFGEFEEFL
jgi:hypothetical protein